MNMETPLTPEQLGALHADLPRCTGPECDRLEVDRGRGLCASHSRQVTDGRPLAPLVKYHQTCAFQDCGRPVSHRASGLCSRHRRQQLDGKPLTPIRVQRGHSDGICTVEGCGKKYRAQGLCGAHYERMKRNGDPLASAPPLVGERHPNWKGDKVSYSGAHMRLRATMGKAEAQSCSRCPEQARTWAYIGPRAVGEEKPYSTRPEDYTPMCDSCHTYYDRQHTIKEIAS